MTKKILSLIIAALLLSATLCSCTGSVSDFNPGTWGYDCMVTYNCLGGVVNQREIRTTYYEPNSYLFEPQGSTGMLIEPLRDNYILAGWYTACEDSGKTDVYGNKIYSFKAEDRWDFEVDRIKEDVTLYAYWVPQAKAAFIDPDSGEELFYKSITAESPLGALSEAVVSLITGGERTLLGYYTDKECTTSYDFSTVTFKPLLPDNKTLYDQLCAEFPDTLAVYEKQDGEDESAAEPDEQEGDSDKISTLKDAQKFLNDLGYQYVTDDEDKLAALGARKKQIIYSYIEGYASGATRNTIYLDLIDGDLKRVVSLESLKSGNSYSFDPGDKEGLVLLCDLDFTGKSVSTLSSFSGIVYGNGHTISNLEIDKIIDKGRFNDEETSVAIFGTCTDCSFNDLVFDNVSVTLSAPAKISKVDATSGNSTSVGIVAGIAENVTFNRCVFNGCTVASEGIALLSDRVVTVGDAVGRNAGNTVFNSCEYDDFTVIGTGSSTVTAPVLTAQ